MLFHLPLQAMLLFIRLSLLAAFCRGNVGLQAEFDFKSTKTFLKNRYLNELFLCVYSLLFLCVCVCALLTLLFGYVL